MPISIALSLVRAVPLLVSGKFFLMYLASQVIHITSQVRLPHLKRGCVKKNVSSSDKSETDSETGEATASSTSPLGLCGIGSALPPPTLNDIRLEKPMFVTRLNPAFKFTFCEAMLVSILYYITILTKLA